jgi:glucose/arabinose dehydrogenase
MRKLIVLAAIAASAAAGAQDQKAQPAAPSAESQKGYSTPQAAYMQGKPADMPDQGLKPYPVKKEVTAPGDIPLDRLKLPQGFKAEIWAHGLPGGRQMARGDKGKIYVGTRDAGKVYELTDTGTERKVRVVVEGLKQPAGVAFKDGTLYVAAIDKVLRFDGIEDRPDVQPVDITEKFQYPDLTKTHHQWKFLAFGPDQKLYIPFGAPCNICEFPDGFAQIRRYNPDGSGMEVVARGIRNTLGFDWHPKTKELWFTENGRDWMGDEGPEDELNRVTKVGEHFGFPYCHANGIPDPQVKKPDPCKGTTKPVALLGPHAAALGMIFYTGTMFPAAYQGTLLLARKGSWNRTKLFGYDVAMVKADPDGKNARVTPFMTGFLDPRDNKFWGRPAYLLQMPDGALLVADEYNGAIYRVTYRSTPSARRPPR